MVSDSRTSSTKSTDETHKRKTSAPNLEITSSGSTPMPSDLDMARPCSSRVQPLVAHSRYGAEPFRATPTSSELWNHPRYWSPPSKYIFDGQGRPFSGVSTAR